VRGVATTIPAHLAVLDHPEFINGGHHTRWMEESVTLDPGSPDAPPAHPQDEELVKRDITVEVGGRRFTVSYWAPEPITPGGGLRRRPPRLSHPRPSGASDGVLTAPMQGTIVKVHVKAGASVKAGDAICVLEAMKMENHITSTREGTVTDLPIRPGQVVETGETLAVID